MSACCSGPGPKFDGMSPGYRHTLWLVIMLNAVMFLVEIGAGALAGSQALKADALDFLGDALTYGISLWAIGKSLTVRSYAAIFKGLSLASMGLWVFGTTIYEVFVLQLPSAGIMGTVGLLALLANLVSVLLLMKYRNGDANVRSVWLCSRKGVSDFLCLGPFLDLSTAADVACDERPTRWSSRLNIVTQLA